MAQVSARIVIKAPVERVFQYFDDPKKEEEWAAAPNVRLAEVRDQRRLPNGGWRERVVVEFGGKRFEVRSEDVEYVPNERIVARTTHDNRTHITSTKRFRPVDGGTEVTYEIEYPISLQDMLIREYRLLAGQRWQVDSLARAKASIEGLPLPRSRRTFASREVLIALGLALAAGFGSNSAVDAFAGSPIQGLLVGTGVVLGVYFLTLELSSAVLRKIRASSRP